ncbi:MAG: helix-turn-helix domain-containing protein [Desulfuromonadaceae bacterium]
MSVTQREDFEKTFTVKDAAAFLHVQPQTMDKFRINKTGPAFVRIGVGRGKILYRLSDLVKYLEANSMRDAA